MPCPACGGVGARGARGKGPRRADRVHFFADPNIVEFVGAVLHKSHGPLLVYERVDGVNMEDYFQMKQRCSRRRGAWRPKLHTALSWSR